LGGPGVKKKRDAQRPGKGQKETRDGFFQTHRKKIGPCRPRRFGEGGMDTYWGPRTTGVGGVKKRRRRILKTRYKKRKGGGTAQIERTPAQKKGSAERHPIKPKRQSAVSFPITSELSRELVQRAGPLKKNKRRP